MIVKSISSIIERDLNKLIEELNLYTNEKDIWIKKGAISNSPGNLTLHLIGNLHHFIGFAIGNTGYKREREIEFSTPFCSREELISKLNATIDVVKASLSNLTDSILYENFPLEKHGEIVTFEHMLLHLLTHLNYHLGQINYHRRLI